MTDGFERFYDEHRDRVFRAVYVSGGDRHAAEDAVSEAFTKACVNWRKLQGHPSKIAWVTRTALNAHRSSWRRGRRTRVGHVPDRVTLFTEPMDPQLFESVLRLPERQRQVIGLRLLLDLSTEETAGVLGIAPGTVTAHLSRAVSSLRASLLQEAQNDGS